MNDVIKIRGARQHNLQNISLDIPKNKLVVFTGVSGSGKSSLAFDTIYAEGQRRYVESLSAYARQFLGVMDKPDVDLIEGLSPSISIDQKTASHNPRSTVGTITEIYDYLRLLFARIGHPHCPVCHGEIAKLSVDEIVDKIINEVINPKFQILNSKQNLNPKIQNKSLDSRLRGNDPPFGFSNGTIEQWNNGSPVIYQILSPIVRGRKGEFKDLFKNLLSKGYKKVIVDRKEMDLNAAQDLVLIKTNKHDIEAVIDTISVSKKDTRNEIFMGNLKTRLRTDVEQATSLSDGLVVLSCAMHGEGHPNIFLFSQNFSCPNCNLSLPELEPRMFSFNSPLGACEKCKGLGVIYEFDESRILKKDLSIKEGGILPLAYIFDNDTWYGRLIQTVAETEQINLSIPIETIPREKLDILLYGNEKTYRVAGNNRFGMETSIEETWHGMVPDLKRRMFESDKNFEEHHLNKYLKEEICDECRGARLKPEILAVTINQKNISEISKFSVIKLLNWLKNDLNCYHDLDHDSRLNNYETLIALPILKEIKSRLKFLVDVGLSYLTVARTAKTLSGGELQRIRLASQIGSGLTGVLYVLDEPSIGLHPRDVSALLNSLKRLRDLGNSLIVVEHDRETMEAADYLVELGPYAGKNGGKVIFEGSLSEMRKSRKSLTGRYLSGKKRIVSVGVDLLAVPGTTQSVVGQTGRFVPTEKTNESLKLKGCFQFNLKNINVKFPLGKLISVTGVSGSGKSTLIVETLYPALKYYLDGYFSDLIGEHRDLTGYADLKKVYLVDQSPIGRTPRSNPATYVKLFDEVREIFAATAEARARGFKKGRFSFNVKGGRCEKCEGAGVLKIEMQFLADVFVTCDVCRGKRYNAETLEIQYKAKTINEILDLTVDDAVDFFVNHFKIHEKLAVLKRVGLGYIKLGQPATTLSGGEAQRIKLADELSKRDTGQNLYILDEPTTGLHFYDIERLIGTLRELVDHGNTVIVIEHNLDVIKNSDWIIDLGPEGGEAGGEVVYQGELRGILDCEKSYTGQYLRKILPASPKLQRASTNK